MKQDRKMGTSMLEFFATLLGVSILIVGWMVIKFGERLTNLEKKLRLIERKFFEAPGRVIETRSQADEKQETEVPGFPQS
ncbi:MAG: hypothetical protein KAT85_03910 [candidate division Zixibacteria bacterium]|nr:hypothetical protein [candidate division Zixibacteria bacterium]